MFQPPLLFVIYLSICPFNLYMRNVSLQKKLVGTKQFNSESTIIVALLVIRIWSCYEGWSFGLPYSKCCIVDCAPNTVSQPISSAAHVWFFFFLGIIWTAMALELMSPCSYRAPNVLSFGALKTKCKFKYNGCMCINNIKVAHSLFISEKLPGKM